MNTKQAPLPPNGTHNRYNVECVCSDGCIVRSTDCSLVEAKAMFIKGSTKRRITARLSDGRKLVLP